MKTIVTAALAALTLGGAALATATPAAAYGWHGGYRGGGWGPGAAIGAGLAGLFVGAAIADHPHYGYGYGYGNGYGYGYPGAYYGGCRSVVRWNPYWGGYQRVRACY